jgi:hypothetical protein
MLETEEKRKSLRYPWVAEIVIAILSPLEVLESPQLSMRVMTENISLGGVGVLGDQLLPPNSIVRCEFAISGSPIPISTLLKLRWADKVEVEEKGQYKFGLQFLF